MGRLAAMEQQDAFIIWWMQPGATLFVLKQSQALPENGQKQHLQTVCNSQAHFLLCGLAISQG